MEIYISTNQVDLLMLSKYIYSIYSYLCVFVYICAYFTINLKYIVFTYNQHFKKSILVHSPATLLGTPC